MYMYTDVHMHAAAVVYKFRFFGAAQAIYCE